jgi:hypothetical protein
MAKSPTANKTVFNTQPTKSTNVPMSRYVQGGLTDVFSNRLGWWDGYILTTAPDDIKIILEPKYNTRPDLLAFDMYGKSTLQWLVLQYNLIVDINTEFVTGVTIVLPSKSRVFQSVLTYQAGGNPVTTVG